jgi:hypothetical protein
MSPRRRIVNDGHASETQREKARELKIGVLNSLYQQFKPVMLGENTFQSPRFDGRAARLIHGAVAGDGSALVSRQDRRGELIDTWNDASYQHALDNGTMQERTATRDRNYLARAVNGYRAAGDLNNPIKRQEVQGN